MVNDLKNSFSDYIILFKVKISINMFNSIMKFLNSNFNNITNNKF